MFWIGLYALLALAPLVIIFMTRTPPERSFWIEFSVALGFIGLAMIALQFVLTARFHKVAAPYGMDVVLQFHRQISYLAFLLILAHPIILFIHDPSYLQLLNFFEAPDRARLAVLAMLGLFLIIGLSIWKDKFRLSYEMWRLTHQLLALLIIICAYGHVLGVGHYLDLPWKRTLWALTAIAVISMLLYVRVLKPMMIRRKAYEVADVVEERGDTHTLVLKRADDSPVMRFDPGQFAWLKVGVPPFSLYENPFSFSSSAEGVKTLTFTIKNLGDFSGSVKDIKPGTRAYVDGPYGIFSYREYPARGYVFIAGGVGITPIMSMLRTLADEEHGGELLLIYANKSWEEVTFREEIEELEKKLNLKTVHVLDEAPEHWPGETGFVTEEILSRHLPEEILEHQYFLCAAPVMMDSVREALREVGVPLTHIHAEQFQLV